MSQVDSEMLVQVKHRGWVFKVFITKGEGEGSTYRGRAGEIFIKEGRRINSMHHTTASTAEENNQRSGS